MNESRKRNIIIGALCGVLLLMAVGYAAFNSLLSIEGTTTISSSWNVRITKVEATDTIGKASNVEGFPTFEDLKANINVNLISPGDSITYDITISNEGNLNAELQSIKISENANDAVIFTHSGIEEGSILDAGDTAVLQFTVQYNPEVTSQPKDTSANATVTLDYVQEGKGSVVPEPEGITTEELKTKVEDGVASDPNPEESGRYVYQGASPKNYITFNGEVAGWRIISIESDESLKIMRASELPEEKAFDSADLRTDGYCANAMFNSTHDGCNVWAQTENFDNHYGLTRGAQGNVSKDSELKIYLNGTYYNTITTNKDAIMINHSWNYGAVDTSLTTVSAMIGEEDDFKANSNVGLISPSDYVKSNTNTSQCGSISAVRSNESICKSTTWMLYSEVYWTLSPFYSSGPGYNLSYVLSVGNLGDLSGTNARKNYGVVPSLYLKPTIKLSGTGSQGDPYKIESVS